MPFGIQPIHLIVIAIIALLIFGPSRLPEIGRGIGKAIKEFQRGTKEMGEGFKDEVTKPVDENQAAAQSTAAPAQPSAVYTQSIPQPLPQPAMPQPIPQAPAQPIQQPVAQSSWQAVTPASPEAQAATSIFCNQCGSPNSTGARFCSKCGAPLQP